MLREHPSGVSIIVINVKVYFALASPADILRGASRIPAPQTGMRDTPLRMSAGEANFALALVGMPLNKKKMIVVVQLSYKQRLRSQVFCNTGL